MTYLPRLLILSQHLILFLVISLSVNCSSSCWLIGSAILCQVGMCLISLLFLLQFLILFYSLAGLVMEELQLFLFCLKLQGFLELWESQGYWEWLKVSKDCKSWFKLLYFHFLLLERVSWFCCSIFSYHLSWPQTSWEASPTTMVRTWTIFSIILLSIKPFKLSLSILLVKIGTITCTFQQLQDTLFVLMEAQLHAFLL